MNKAVITLGTSAPTFAEVIAVARNNAEVVISQEALDAMAATRVHVEALAASPYPVYGVSTGFGALANRHIPADMRTQLQKSLIRSHAAGIGAEVEREVIRATMFLRLKTITSGRTGVRPEVAQTYAAILNAGITPIVHEFGSLGCSGDLAPLAHCALVAMGEGRARNIDGDSQRIRSIRQKDSGCRRITQTTSSTDSDDAVDDHVRLVREDIDFVHRYETATCLHQRPCTVDVPGVRDRNRGDGHSSSAEVSARIERIRSIVARTHQQQHSCAGDQATNVPHQTQDVCGQTTRGDLHQ